MARFESYSAKIGLKGKVEMKEIFYPGFHGSTGRALFDVARYFSNGIAHGNIVVVWKQHPHGGTSLYNTDDGRNKVLNDVLASTLVGTRVEWVKFYVILDLTSERDAFRKNRHFVGFDFDIIPDIDAWFNDNDKRPFIKKVIDRLFNKPRSVWSGHLVGGKVTCYSDLEKGRQLSQEEIESLCATVNYSIENPYYNN